MKKYAFVNPDGSLAYTASPSTDDQYVIGGLYNELRCIEVPLHVSEMDLLVRYRFMNNQLVELAPRPSDRHIWSGSAWVPDLITAKADLDTQIERERDKRIYSLIAYDNKVIDADPVSQKNLANKIAEMQAKKELNLPTSVEMLLWRDADNVTHSWETAEAYLDWLYGFAVVLSERGTQIYASSWQHKGNIAALTTLEALENYNIDSLWP
jgi:hypothetical protein